MPGSTGGGYRAVMWLLFAAGLLNLWTAVRSARGGNATAGVSALAIFFVCLSAGAWFGWRRARLLRSSQEQRSRSDAILILVTELGRHGDETLQRIAGQGGPAGEAALVVLQGRRGRAKQ